MGEAFETIAVARPFRLVGSRGLPMYQIKAAGLRMLVCVAALNCITPAGSAIASQNWG
ncbi:hypothetical protein ABIC09_006445 [Bradyrhizobium sp. S3.12.5]